MGWALALILSFASLFATADAQIPAINSVITQPVTALPPIGPVVAVTPLPDPPVPGNLAAIPNGSNFRIWIYDPRTRSNVLGSPRIFIAPNGGSFTFRSAAADGSLYMQLAAGTYNFDVVEPSTLSNLMTRKRYKATVSAAGAVTVDGVVADSRGIYAVTVIVNVVDALAQQRLAALTALANEPASTFFQTSECQLRDQITPNRSLSVDLSAGFPKVRTRLPSYGRIKALIVPLDFAEVPGADNPITFFTPVAEGVRDMYYTASYGRLAFDFNILSSWVRLPFLASKYNLGGAVGAGDPVGYLKEILSLTDSLIDYTQYDAVYFLVPRSMPYSTMGWGPAITFPITVKNGYITNGAIGGADMYLVGNGPNAARNWLAHETGHAFGLYDEDLDHASATLGSWSLMANSWSRNVIEHNGWDRYLQGWLGETQVACLPTRTLGGSGTTVKLNPLVRQNAETKVAMVPLSTSKMLVMESRKSEGLDNIAANREGVLVYTVDMTIGQLKGGYRTQRRAGSTDVNFEDAALRAGDTITVDGIEVSVLELSSSGDTIRVKSSAAPNPPPLARRGGVDLDGLGRSQLLLRNANGQMLSGRFANNTFSFSAAGDPGAAFNVVAAGDLDGNGKSDLVFRTQAVDASGRVTANAWRDFQPSAQITLRMVKPEWVVQASADLDGDGYGDLLFRWTGDDGIPNNTGVSFIWFQGAGGAYTAVRKRGGAPLNWSMLGAADLNGDGAADMLYLSPAGQLRALMATSGRTCANLSAGAVPAGFSVLKFADFSGGRRGDLLIRDAAGNTQLLSLNASGVILPPYTGDPDDQNAACTSSTQTVANRVSSLPAVSPTWSFYASGDFNGDGTVDIVWLQPNGTLTVWLMNFGAAPTVVNNAGTIPSGGYQPIPLQ